MELETAIKNLVRIGHISSVDKINRTAKVIFADRGTVFVSGDLKILKNPPFIPEKDVPQQTEFESGGSGDSAFENHKHDVIISPWLPDIDDLVLCLYLGSENGDGFIIGGI